MKARASLIVLLLAAFPAVAAEPRMICFGNEPSWSLQFADVSVARFLLPDARPVEYRGSETRLDHLGERAWRGRPAKGAGGDLVAFLSEAACSDGMSDAKHALTARVSLADGRFLAGCCRRVDAPAAAPKAAASIEGPIWQLASLRGLDPGSLRDAIRPVTARFKAGRIDGFSGCNLFFGGYTIDGDRVVIGSLGGTMMACPESPTAVENAVRAALAGPLRYTLADHLLTLHSGAEPVIVFQMQPARTLEGATWKVTGFNNGRQAVVSPLLGTTLSLTFRGGIVKGFGGCNTFRAKYSADGDRIVLGPASATRKACVSEGVMQQEREFLRALEATTTWAFDGELLDMHRADGERALTATRRVD